MSSTKKQVVRYPSRLRDTARYGSLLAAGACIFLGLALLMPIIGVTWHSNYQYLRLDAYVFSTSADLMIWVIAFALSTFPFYASVKRDRSTLHDLLLTFSNLILPPVSIMMGLWSYKGAVAGLAVSGFMVAYGLVRRSPCLLRIASRDAFRIVASATLTCLAGLSAISILGMATGGEKTLRVLSTAATLSKETLSNPWLRAMTLDLEFFFLLRPALPSLILILVFVAVLTVLSDTRIDPVKLLAKSLKRRNIEQQREKGSPSHNRPVSIVAALLVIGSVLVGALVTLYPYVFGHVDGMLGSDTWYYLQALRTLQDPFVLATSSDRPVFLLFLLGVKYLTGASPLSVVIYTPLMLSTLLSLSTLALVRQGTRDGLLASVAALFSVVSSQTAIGLGTAILANWFALALVNVFFALLLKAQMDQSRLGIVASCLVSLLVLLAHPFTWAASMAMIAIQLLAIMLSGPSKLREIKRDMIPIASVILLNAVFLFLVFSLAGGARYSLTVAFQQMQSPLRIADLSSLVTFLGTTIDYARNRLDMTFMIILSIIGILDTSLVSKRFRRVLASMMIVPIFFTLLAPDINWTWRGLYLLPTYLTATLGIRSIALRVNSHPSVSRRESVLRLGFSGSMLAYVLLASFAWALRATLLLMETSVVVR
jgi:hypothetical protein